jgi:hypothetical protein
MVRLWYDEAWRNVSIYQHAVTSFNAVSKLNSVDTYSVKPSNHQGNGQCLSERCTMPFFVRWVWYSGKTCFGVSLSQYCNTFDHYDASCNGLVHKSSGIFVLFWTRVNKDWMGLYSLLWMLPRPRNCSMHQLLSKPFVQLTLPSAYFGQYVHLSGA